MFRGSTHVTMVLLAMLALLRMQIELGSKAYLLTVQDVKEILEVIPQEGRLNAHGDLKGQA